MAGTTTTRGAPPPMAAGGTTGQVLTKASNNSYDTEWTTPAGGGGTVTDVTASAPLSSTGGATPDISIGGGTAGQVLTSNGASAPTFEDLPAPPTVPDASDATPQGIGTAAPGISADYARGDHVHAGTVTALTDRYEELPAQTFSDFAHGSLVPASPTRDIQTAIDATPVGPACQVIVGPGSYGGATVTIPTGRNNISIIGPSAGDFGGTIATLSSGRGLTIGNNAVRVRVANIQVEGLTTISTTGAGVHRIERCQLLGGLTLGAISQTVYVVGCDVGNVVVPAGFTGVLLFDRCLFLGTLTNNSGSALRVAISDSAGVFAAPTTSATLNGRWQFGASTTFYAGGVALLGAPLTAINSLTPAADRIAYYTSASAGAMTALTPFARTLLDDADAATARTTLGLGTAATQNSTAFQAADATLTALAGVTTAANKLPYFTGVDTAAVADITTAGREILSTATSGTNGQVLTSSGGGAPTWTTVSGSGSGYAADSWDDSFSDPNGAVPTGWTAETSPVITYPVVGSGTAIQLASTTNPARLTATYAGFGANTVWEARVEMRASQVGTANESAVVIRDGTKRISIYPSTSGLVLEAGLMELLMPHAVNDWFIWTIRRSGTRVYFWSGPRMLYAYSYASLTADITLAGSVRLGTSTSATRTTQIRAWWVKFGSVNDAPPDYTFRTTYFGRP